MHRIKIHIDTLLYLGELSFMMGGSVVFTPEGETSMRCVGVMATDDQQVEDDLVVSVFIDTESLVPDLAGQPSQVFVTIRDNDGEI